MKRHILLILAAIVMTLGQGCATMNRPRSFESPELYTQTISFDRDMIIPVATAVQNPDDPHEIVMFALSLSRMGRHQHAAAFLAEAAGRFDSLNNEFAVACYAAAANEYLNAGDMEQFRTAVRRLRGAASRYQIAAFDQHTLSLMTLGDIATGGARPNELTPRPLRVLYADPQ